MVSIIHRIIVSSTISHESLLIFTTTSFFFGLSAVLHFKLVYSDCFTVAVANLKGNKGDSHLKELIRLKLHRTALLVCLCAITGLVVVVLNSIILVNFNAVVSNAVAALVRINLMFLTQLGSGIVSFGSSTMDAINKESPPIRQ